MTDAAGSDRVPCPRCGAPIVVGWESCPYCGEPLGSIRPNPWILAAFDAWAAAPPRGRLAVSVVGVLFVLIIAAHVAGFV